jgi:hypothetical protein
VEVAPEELLCGPQRAAQPGRVGGVAVTHEQPQRGEDVGLGALCLDERRGEGEGAGARGEFVLEAEPLGRGDAREGKPRQRLARGEANATATLRPWAYGGPCMLALMVISTRQNEALVGPNSLRTV